MAKEKTKEAPKKAPKEEAAEFKYGVKDLAEKLGIDPAAARVKLRNAGVEKAGKSYGWNTKAELAEVADELTAEKPAKKADKKAPAKEEKAPKSKKADKEEAKPAKKKKKDDDD